MSSPREQWVRPPASVQTPTKPRELRGGQGEWSEACGKREEDSGGLV